MQRFDQVADHAIGTEPLQTRAPGDRVTLPEPRPQRRHPLPPLAPQERANQQRIAATLVTDGGNITDVGQGKTIAINALAERMRSATPEVALAALGLNVGTDMVNRLGFEPPDLAARPHPFKKHCLDPQHHIPSAAAEQVPARRGGEVGGRRTAAPARQGREGAAIRCSGAREGTPRLRTPGEGAS
ncbi:hypothetical protein F4561_002121 [Lipingzhangella halophila]|uniref:Uncharacterized protein n=1 Tax=Lipingzhangella halophila TaxID=1783352 RepID=A0A7W7RH19_9ACTN|nr:hypothetical protein [Lipingzhangella halophila]MBB4931301.1 hypothetical protein [Lipingzhangella halophila]